ncbi:hypothetical protein [Streptomyces formicae]|uniref:Fibronectin type-III domain-containing protein n=1 Tax=Streptomyces formicae TaxID=1616117 RepID=A0ABY3WJN0_9ACTN|nr:hypothetical protein [Streptomyces formicae]UNM12808.1 hypothetical protein J4032_15940 [Streptomyces formicae]
MPKPIPSRLSRAAVAGAAVAGALAVSVPAPAYAEDTANLVVNGDFEQVGADGSITGWPQNETRASGRATIVDGAGPDGSRALALDLGDAADKAAIGQDVPIPDTGAFRAYRITFDERAVGLDGYGGDLWARNFGHDAIVGRITGDTGWRKASAVVLARPGAPAINLLLALEYTTGRLLVDNVTVERIEGNAVGANVQPTGAVQLTWHFGALAETPASYEVHRSSDADFRPGRRTLIREVPAAWTAEDGSARPGTRYAYKVVALAADGTALATTDAETVTTPSRFLDEQRTDVLTATGTDGGARLAWRLKAGTKGPVKVYAGGPEVADGKLGKARKVATDGAHGTTGGLTLRSKDLRGATGFAITGQHGEVLATATLASLKHPRMGVTGSKLTAIRAAIQQPGTPKSTYDSLVSKVATGLPAYNYRAGEAQAAWAHDAALLYQVTQDPAHARTAYDAVIESGRTLPFINGTAHAGASPLETANAAAPLATAYDWAYPGWTEQQRAEAQKVLQRVAAYLEVAYHPNFALPAKQSNWTAVVRGAELVLRLAVRGDGPFDLQEDRLPQLVDEVGRHLDTAYSDNGWDQEGTDYFSYGLGVGALGITGSVDAGIGALKEKWQRPQFAGLIMHSISAQADRSRLQWGVGYGSGSVPIPGFVFTQVPADQRAAWLWQYEKTVGGGGGTYGLLNYPYGTTPQDPDEGPRAVRAAILDDHVGSFLFRSRYQDKDDVLVGLQNRNEHHIGWNGSDTFGLSVIGQDAVWARQPGKDYGKPELFSKPLVDGKVEPAVGKGRTLESRAYEGQGGGFVSLDGSGNYQLDRARRDIAVDLRPVGGADSVIAVHDAFADDTSHTYAWQLSPEAGTTITFGETESGAKTFLFKRGDGWLKGWILDPEGAELSVEKGAFKVVRTGTEADFRVVLAVGKGAPSTATAEGGTLTLGGTTYDLDGLGGFRPAGG